MESLECLYRVYWSISIASTIHLLNCIIYKCAFPMSKLTLCANHLEQTPTVTQNDLALPILGREPDLLKAILDVSCSPHLRDELIARFNRGGKAGLELLKVLRVATAEFPQDTMGSRVPAIQAMNNGPAEAHFLAGLRSRVQGVVVTIESVRQC